MKPHILHVVGYSEGDHATFPGELIESCQIVHGVVRNSLNGLPDVWADENILSRKAELVYEAKVLIESLGYLGADCDDPKAEPYVIASAIKEGFLDTPHFKGNPHLCGNIITGLVNGAWYAINPSTGEPIDEEFRLRGIINRLNKQ